MANTDDQTFHDVIEGYCGALSYDVGDTVELHTSTSAAMYDVTIERWGAVREQVWSARNLEGSDLAVPDDADANGCGWPVAVSVEVDPTWQTGFYLVTLTAHNAERGRDTAHAGFVVRSEQPGSMLYVVPTNTWNAYNTWGGRSLYTGGTQVSFHRPFARAMLCRPDVERDDRKARPTRFGETPDVEGHIFQEYRTANAYPSAIGSTGWFTYGRRFVEWAEGEGYEFDYVVSSDLGDADVLDGYDTVLLVGHDEYWSAPERATVDAFVARGGNLASFSGNTMFWRVRIEPATHGTTMVCHKYAGHRSDPALHGDSAFHGDSAPVTGMWADPVVGEPEWALLGAGSAFGLYHRFGQATARGVGGFIVYRHHHWLFDNTDLGYGDVLGRDDGVVGYETVGCPITLDDYQLPIPSPFAFSLGVPESTEIVACVPSSNLGVGEYPKSIAALSDQGDLEFIADRIFGNDPNSMAKARYGNAVMLTCRPHGNDGGEVVTIGTTDWVFGLAEDAAVQQVTKNVLDRLG